MAPARRSALNGRGLVCDHGCVGAGRGKKIFVSSTFNDNERRREIVKETLAGAGMLAERLTAGSQPTVEEGH